MNAYEDDPLVSRLLVICAGLVKGEAAGPHDDLFAAGLDSIGAMRVTSHISNEFGVELPVAAVYECRTVGRLREVIRDAGGAGIEEGEI